MTTATMRLIEAVERLNMTGEIGDGRLAQLHDLAAAARLEQRPVSVINAIAVEPIRAFAPVMIADGGRCRQCGCPR